MSSLFIFYAYSQIVGQTGVLFYVLWLDLDIKSEGAEGELQPATLKNGNKQQYAFWDLSVYFALALNLHFMDHCGLTNQKYMLGRSNHDNKKKISHPICGISPIRFSLVFLLHNY